jgi:hypothetical protein
MNSRIDLFIFEDQVHRLATCYDPLNIRQVIGGLT